MTQREQSKAFAIDLDNLVDRYRYEFDLTYESVIGVLFIKSHLLANEADELGEEDEDDEEEGFEDF
jgi:hypothetical protein